MKILDIIGKILTVIGAVVLALIIISVMILGLLSGGPFAIGIVVGIAYYLLRK